MDLVPPLIYPGIYFIIMQTYGKKHEKVCLVGVLRTWNTHHIIDTAKQFTESLGRNNAFIISAVKLNHIPHCKDDSYRKSSLPGCLIFF